MEALEAWKAERDQAAVDAALERLADAAGDESQNVMPATIEAAKAGATTGEWAGALREVFGDYRAPTGVSGAAAPNDEQQLTAVRERVDELARRIGRRPRILVGKPGLDGHSNGAEQIAVRARDVGMEVIYQGIRLTPEQIAASAVEEDVDVVGLSILSGSHLELIPETVRLLREHEVDAPVVIGGIIPLADAEKLRAAGVARVYTPKDFDVTRIMGEIVDLVGERAEAGARPLEPKADRVPGRRAQRRRRAPAADRRSRHPGDRRRRPGPRDPALDPGPGPTARRTGATLTGWRPPAVRPGPTSRR